MSIIHRCRSFAHIREEHDKKKSEEPTRGFLILEAEDLHTFDNIVTSVVRDALIEYLLNYAEPEEASDDRWWYRELKETLYTDDGEVNEANFCSEMGARAFIQDPYGGYNGYYNAVGKLFELIIYNNRGSIQTLYESYNIKALDAIIYRNTIVLDIRGKKI